ncbi:sodium/glutamate symporter [Photobacterium rosenbergii]|uniref:Sodium/glutamate symporter n=1 Tax=Photobacterium rosenbergii TaxID=294936 RepID=A0ABU3ZEL2_9GAMM|nr:sodium/glutamate symporter [Photobacterium rosenbergii]MDV5168537.1 sodium/glutamate symporter [Photobacterium rosenbergii]
MDTLISIGTLESFLIAICVLILGLVINKHVAVFRKFSIPEPIVGGLVIACIITTLHLSDIQIEFDLPLQNTLMLMFFSTVGLAASFKQLAKGGAKVFVFLLVASIYIIIQNGVGVGMATMLGLEPLMGLIAGSITLSGGHGTGAAWAQTFSDSFGLEHTMEIAMAAATFGLVMGGIIGSPVGKRLINKNALTQACSEESLGQSDVVTFIETKIERVTAQKVIGNLFLIMLCVTGAKYLHQLVNGLEVDWLMIPDFVYALFIGVIITNICDVLKVKPVDTETTDILGTVSLYLFLAMALMSLKLWNIFDLALPFLLILITQTVILALFSYFVTFRLMGKNYDAAVISAGHCGFGLGATPTAVMNMGTLVNEYGPSPQAFVVIPIVGAFFIDMVNLVILQGFISVIA